MQEHRTYFEVSLYITSAVHIISSGDSMTLVGVGSALLAKIITKGKRKGEGKISTHYCGHHSKNVIQERKIKGLSESLRLPTEVSRNVGLILLLQCG